MRLAPKNPTCERTSIPSRDPGQHEAAGVAEERFLAGRGVTPTPSAAAPLLCRWCGSPAVHRGALCDACHDLDRWDELEGLHPFLPGLREEPFADTDGFGPAPRGQLLLPVAGGMGCVA